MSNPQKVTGTQRAYRAAIARRQNAGQPVPAEWVSLAGVSLEGTRESDRAGIAEASTRRVAARTADRAGRTAAAAAQADAVRARAEQEAQARMSERAARAEEAAARRQALARAAVPPLNPDTPAGGDRRRLAALARLASMPDVDPADLGEYLAESVAQGMSDPDRALAAGREMGADMRVLTDRLASLREVNRRRFDRLNGRVASRLASDEEIVEYAAQGVALGIIPAQALDGIGRYAAPTRSRLAMLAKTHRASIEAKTAAYTREDVDAGIVAAVEAYRRGEDLFETIGRFAADTLAGKAGGADRNRGGAEQLRRYWTRGAGGQRIRWGVPGDFRRCVAEVERHMPGRAEGYCANRHREATGQWPGAGRRHGRRKRKTLRARVVKADSDGRTGDGGVLSRPLPVPARLGIIERPVPFQTAGDGPFGVVVDLTAGRPAECVPGDLRTVVATLADMPGPVNLALLHVAGTDLFDTTRGVARVEMPQVPQDRHVEFVGWLAAAGIGTVEETVDPWDLRGTQAELDAAKVWAMVDAPAGAGWLIVSSDDWVLDGHHRWAAAAVGGHPVRVRRVGVGVEDLFDLARRWCSEVGMTGRAFGKTRRPVDADGDGFIDDGKPTQRPAPRSTLTHAMSSVHDMSRTGFANDDDIRAVMEMSLPKGHRSSIGKIDRDDDRIIVEGQIMDGDGNPVGSFVRDIFPDGTVTHQTLRLNKASQGKGIGMAFFTASIDRYRAAGVRQVKVSTEDVGGYTWARAGFKFANDESRETVRQRARKWVNSSNYDDTAVLIDGMTGRTSKFQPADLVAVSPAAAKQILLGAKWDGVLDLTPEAKAAGADRSWIAAGAAHPLMSDGNLDREGLVDPSAWD